MGTEVSSIPKTTFDGSAITSGTVVAARIDAAIARVTALRSLGAWVSKSLATAYQAATDGWVVAWYDCDGAYSVVLRAKSDGSNPPTTIRSAGEAKAAENYDTGVCCPVKSGDYYMVEMARSGGAGATAIYWIPLE